MKTTVAQSRLAPNLISLEGSESLTREIVFEMSSSMTPHHIPVPVEPSSSLGVGAMPDLRSVLTTAAGEGSRFSLAQVRGIPADGFNSFSPADLSTVERELERVFLCPDQVGVLGLLHVEGRTFERVSAKEAELFRDERTNDERRSQGVNAALQSALIFARVKDALEDTVILPGRASRSLAHDLGLALGVRVDETVHKNFSSSESFAKISESVRGKHVVIAQQIIGDADNALSSTELLLDAASRASARSITLLMPYLPYQRQDRRGAERTAVTPKVLFGRLEKAGRGRLKSIVTVDMHALQAEGMSGDINVDNLSGASLLVPRLRELVGNREIAVVYADAGERKRKQEDGFEKVLIQVFGRQIAGFGSMRKARDDEKEVKESVFEGDPALLKGRTVLFFDDMIDTGGTGRKGITELWKHGPESLYYASTHGLFNELAVEKFRSFMVTVDGAPRRGVDKVLVTNSVPLRRGRADLLETVSLTPMLAHFLAGVVSDGGFSTRDLQQLYGGVRGVTSGSV